VRYPDAAAQLSALDADSKVAFIQQCTKDPNMPPQHKLIYQTIYSEIALSKEADASPFKIKRCKESGGRLRTLIFTTGLTVGYITSRTRTVLLSLAHPSACACACARATAARPPSTSARKKRKTPVFCYQEKQKQLQAVSPTLSTTLSPSSSGTSPPLAPHSPPAPRRWAC